MDNQQIASSSQEQATASWINYLNQVRLERFTEALSKEQDNLHSAFQSIDTALDRIANDIVNNGKGRGGQSGMHGFIAEIAECGVGNARKQIEGKLPDYIWVNDNGPEDLRRGAVLIQQKFVQSGGHLSLKAALQHLEHYPDFLEKGGVYQIPSDHYERIQWLRSISKEQAYKMPTSEEFSFRQWQEVQDFFSSGKIPPEKLEPSLLDYKGVQRNAYEQTLSAEKQSLKARNQERTDLAYRQSKPTIAEGAKATVAAAAVEGVMTLSLGIIRKRKEKPIREFGIDDWKELGGESGIGTLKGGIRGASIYLLTNYTATPASVASSLVTASFGIANQAHQFRQGHIDEVSFIENSEVLCLDAAISAISSFAGQIIVPVPVLGAVIGNAVGMLVYQLGKDALSERERKLLENHLASINALNAELDQMYHAYLEGINDYVVSIVSLLSLAFAPDVKGAFDGSISLAKAMGVPADEILDSPEKVFAFFVD